MHSFSPYTSIPFSLKLFIILPKEPFFEVREQMTKAYEKSSWGYQNAWMQLEWPQLKPLKIIRRQSDSPLASCTCGSPLLQFQELKPDGQETKQKVQKTRGKKEEEQYNVPKGKGKGNIQIVAGIRHFTDPLSFSQTMTVQVKSTMN